MKEIITEIVFTSKPELVWQTLTSFKDYINWNPFIIEAGGELITGEKISIAIDLEGSKQHFKPVITQVSDNSYFEWEGSLPFNIFNGKHYFKIEDIGDGKVKLIHGERFTGWLSGFIFGRVGEKTERGFVRMNKALKTKLETND